MSGTVKCFTEEGIIHSYSHNTLLKLYCEKSYVTYFQELLKDFNNISTIQEGFFAQCKVNISKVPHGNGVVIDQMEDTQKIGELVRTGFSLGVKNFILISPKLSWNNDDIAYHCCYLILGSIFLFHYNNPEEFLYNTKKYKIISLVPGLSWQYHGDKKECLLVIGNECNGISKIILEHSQYFHSIPMEKQVESLPAATALGIFLGNI